jgi:hypothetical protein
MIYKKILPTILILVLPLTMLAQGIGEPCDDSDPFDNYCPIDNWVWVLVGVCMVFTVINLYKKQNAKTEF